MSVWIRPDELTCLSEVMVSEDGGDSGAGLWALLVFVYFDKGYVHLMCHLSLMMKSGTVKTITRVMVMEVYLSYRINDRI